MSRIGKRSMRNPPRATIINRIVALDKKGLVRSLCVLEVPPMAWIRLDGVRLAFAVGIDQRGGDEVAVRHGVGVCESERISEDGLDGTPDVDDLKTLAQKLVCLIREVVPDTVLRGSIGLVDVNSFSRPAELGGSIAEICRCTADGMIEDEKRELLPWYLSGAVQLLGSIPP